MSTTPPQWTPPDEPDRSGDPAHVGDPAHPGLAVPPAYPGSPGPPGQWGPPPVRPEPTPSAYAEYKPGIVPLRPLALGDIYGGVITAIRGNLAATLGLSLVVTIVAVIPATVLGLWWTRNNPMRLPEEMGPESRDLFASLGSNFPSLASAVTAFVLSAFMAYVIGQGVIGRQIGSSETWTNTRARLGSVLVASLLVGLVFVALFAVTLGGPIAVMVSGARSGSEDVLGLGFLLLFLGVVVAVIGIVWLGTRVALTNPAIVLEQVGAVTGIRRSWALTARGQFWRIFGIRALALLITMLVSAVLSFPLSAALGFVVGKGGADLGTLLTASVFVAALTTLVTGTLTTPFTAGTDALLYIDQRIRREGLDVALIRSAREHADGHRG